VWTRKKQKVLDSPRKRKRKKKKKKTESKILGRRNYRPTKLKTKEEISEEKQKQGHAHKKKEPNTRKGSDRQREQVNGEEEGGREGKRGSGLAVARPFRAKNGEKRGRARRDMGKESGKIAAPRKEKQRKGGTR